jgi:glycosyltransferase involved in cell wall biosynthesis
LFEGSFIVSSSLASRSVKADIVLAVTPNLGALPVAAAIARRNRAPLGVIVQDLIGQAASQSGMRAAMPMAGLIGRLEARWLRAADVVGVVSRGFVGPLVAGGLDESRLVHLPNYTHVVPAPNGKVAARRALGWPVESFYVVHTGNMGFKQDLSNVIASARLAQEAAPSMRFMFVGDGSQRAAVEKSSRGLKNVMLSPVLSSADYPLALAAADVLLVNERPTVKDMSLPSKLTSYFAAGRPILAATRADGATAEEVHRAGGGVVVTPGNPAALLQKLQLLAGDDELRAKLARTGRNYSEANLSRVEGRNRIIEFVAQLTHFDANPDVRGAGGE